jgi:hypothetical protein
MGRASDVFGFGDAGQGGAGFDDFGGFDDIGGGQDWGGAGDTTFGDEPFGGRAELDQQDRDHHRATVSPSKSTSSPRKRAAAARLADEVPAFDELAEDAAFRGRSGDYALAIFDVPTDFTAVMPSQSQYQRGDGDETPGADVQPRTGGYSKNTVKALKVLTEHLPTDLVDSDDADAAETGAHVSFVELSKGVSLELRVFPRGRPVTFF